MDTRRAEPSIRASGGTVDLYEVQDATLHSTSKRVAEAIAKEPGIHKSALARRLGLGWGALDHHVGQLLRQNRIQSTQEDRKVFLFPVGVAPDDARCMALLRDDVSRALVSVLEEEPGRRLNELSHATGATASVVRSRLRGLVEHGLVQRRGKGQSVYEANLELLGRTRWLMEHARSMPQDALDRSGDEELPGEARGGDAVAAGRLTEVGP